MDFSVPAVPGQNPAHQMDPVLPSGNALPSSHSANHSATQHRATEHEVPAEISGAWEQEWVMGALLSDRLTPCQSRTLPRNRSPTPGTSHPHTGPTVQWYGNADLYNPDRTGQICWEWCQVTLMFRNIRLWCSLMVFLCYISPMWCARGGDRRPEGCWGDITEDKRAAYRSLTQKKWD